MVKVINSAHYKIPQVVDLYLIIDPYLITDIFLIVNLYITSFCFPSDLL